MEPRDTRDSIDNLITETLQRRMGPTPSKKVWAGISRELAPRPRYPRLRDWLSLVYIPMTRSALVVAMFLLLILQPAYHWLNQEAPVRAPTYTQPAPAPALERPLPLEDQLPDEEEVAPPIEEDEEPTEMNIAPAQLTRSVEAQ